MSKRFKTQDYHRFKRLGTRWRKPSGRQSKLRVRKSGSGILVSIGYGTKKSERNKIRGMKYVIASSLKDVENAKEAVIISSSVGARKAVLIADAAVKAGLKILNMKKAKAGKRTAKEIEVKRKMKELEKKERQKEKKQDEKKEEKNLAEKAKTAKKEEPKIEHKTEHKDEKSGVHEKKENKTG